MISLSRQSFFPSLFIAALLLTGCKDQAPQARPPTEVAYVSVKTEEVAVINELSGRLESYRNSDVRARVAGVLEKRLFEEGSNVKKGDRLFVIDPRSYQASVQNAQAALARAEANFMQADLKHKRYTPLVGISAVSKQEYDDALAAQKQAAADVAAARAALVNARLDLEYATVLAPISGRIGRSIVTEGALVGQGEVTLLAVIQQIDPIYLNLTQSSAELLQLQQAMRKGILKGASEEGLKVTLLMEDGSTYPHTGKLLFSDISVDPSTGEISIRALFPNPEHLLLPGMYVRGRLEQAINEHAITIPKQAVQRSTEGSTVMVITPEDTAEIRKVETGASHGEKWVVSSGLKAGERVIVEGLQKVRPGAPVKPVPWEKEIAKTPLHDAAEPVEGKTEQESAATDATEKPAEALPGEKPVLVEGQAPAESVKAPPAPVGEKETPRDSPVKAAETAKVRPPEATRVSTAEPAKKDITAQSDAARPLQKTEPPPNATAQVEKTGEEKSGQKIRSPAKEAVARTTEKNTDGTAADPARQRDITVQQTETVIKKPTDDLIVIQQESVTRQESQSLSDKTVPATAAPQPQEE